MAGYLLSPHHVKSPTSRSAGWPANHDSSLVAAWDRSCRHYVLLLAVGFILCACAIIYDQILPRLDGSAEPTLTRIGIWAFQVTNSNPVPPGQGPPILLNITVLASFASFYIVALALARRLPSGRPAQAIILAVAILLTATLVLSPPLSKADEVYYAFEGRMVVRLHANPYLVPPRQLVTDPWFPYLSSTWRNLTTGYGPTWLLITGAVDAAVDRGSGAEGLANSLLAMRTFLAALTIGEALLIWSILGQIAPARQVLGSVAFAWNPVVVLVGNTHNDTVMLFFVLLGLWLHLHHRRYPAIAALTVGTLVKYYTAPLLLAFLVWQYREDINRGWKRFLPAVIVLLTTAALLVPFNPVAVARQFPVYLSQSGRITHVTDVPATISIVLVILCVALILRAKTFQAALSSGTLSLFVYLVFFTRDWFPWYLVTVVGLAALLGGWWLVIAATASASWLLSLHEGTAYLAGLASSWHLTNVGQVQAGILFVPILLILILGALGRHFRLSHWTLAAIGIISIVSTAVAVARPIALHPNRPPVLADLGGGLFPGPVIFGSALEWDDWSWKTRVAQSLTPSGPGTGRSLCLSFDRTNAAFYAHHHGFSTQGYKSLSVDVNLPSSRSTGLTIVARGQNGESLGQADLDHYIASSSNVDGWSEVQIPLTALHASGETITGILVERFNPSAVSNVCLRQLRFG